MTSLADVAHVPVFAGIAALLFVALGSVTDPARRAALVAAASAAIGLMVEVVQYLTGTGSFEVSDLGFDLLGILIGLAVAAVALTRVRPVVAGALVVAGVVAGLLVLPARDGPPAFEYASNAVERRCRRADPPSARPDAEPARPEPVARYRLDEGEGSVVHDAAGGPDLLIGNPAGVSWVPEGGLAFSGAPPDVGSRAPAAAVTTAVAATGEVSVEVWFTPDGLPQTGPARLVTISEGADFGEASVHVGIEGRAVSFRVRTDCDFFNWTLTDGTLVSGERRHVVATYRPGSIVIFVDGGRVVSESVPAGRLDVWDPELRLHLGDEATGDRPFVGVIHEVAVFDRALTSDDVADRFATGPAR